MKIEINKPLELVGVLVVVVSLIFVGYELRQNRLVAVNESFGTSIETTTQMLAYLGENSSVWRRGCVGEELTDDEDLLFSTMVRALDRVSFFRYLRGRDGISELDPEIQPNRIASHRVWYPGFNEKWLEIWEQVDRGGGPYYLLVESNYQTLKNELKPGQFGPELCGIAGI